MVAEEFNKAKEVLTERAAYAKVLDELAKAKTDAVDLRKITIYSQTKEKQTFPECLFKLDSFPTSIKEKASEIIKDAYVAFEATVAHRIKIEIERLDNAFKEIPCTKEK